MAHAFEPHESFFSAVASVWLRMALCLLTAFGAYCLHLETSDFELSTFFVWIPSTLWLVLWWGNYGLWFIVGFLAFICGIAFAYAFVQDWRPHITYFAFFTCAAIFFPPLAFDADRFKETFNLYVGVSICLLVWPCRVPAALFPIIHPLPSIFPRSAL